MASTIKVDKLDPQSGTALEIGTSGDTITVPTGAGLTVTDEVKTNKISPATGVAFALGDSGDTFTVPSGATIVNSGTATGFGGGKIGQIISTHNETDSSMSSTSFADVSGQSVAITPSASGSKILIVCTISYGIPQDTRAFFKLLRGTTVIGSRSDTGSRIGCNVSASINSGTAANENLNVVTLQYLDSPSTTSETTYKIQASSNSGNTLTFNRTTSDTDAAYTARATSSITAYEVLA